MRVKAKATVNALGREFHTGDEFDLPDNEAQPMIAAGQVEEVKGASAKPMTTENTSALTGSQQQPGQTVPKK